MTIVRALGMLAIIGATVLTGCQNVMPAAGPAVPARTAAQSLEGVTMGYRQVAQQLFDNQDTNKSNTLEQAEFDELRKAGAEVGQIQLADRNLDGKVSRDEFMDPTYVKLIVDQIRFKTANVFQQLDRNDDGRLTKAEVTAGKLLVSKDVFAIFDRNDTNALGLSEFEDLIWVELAPKAINPLHQLRTGMVGQPAEPSKPAEVAFSVKLLSPHRVQSLMIKQVEATTPVFFATRPQVIPALFEKKLAPGIYSVTVRLTSGTAGTRRIEIAKDANVFVSATQQGPIILTEAEYR